MSVGKLSIYNAIFMELYGVRYCLGLFVTSLILWNFISFVCNVLLLCSATIKLDKSIICFCMK